MRIRTKLIAARERLRQKIRHRISDDFRALMDGPGGSSRHWCGNPDADGDQGGKKTTIRVLPDEEFRSAEAPANCLKCGRASRRAVWAKRTTTGFTRVGGQCCKGRSARSDRPGSRYAVYVYSGDHSRSL